MSTAISVAVITETSDRLTAHALIPPDVNGADWCCSVLECGWTCSDTVGDYPEPLLIFLAEHPAHDAADLENRLRQMQILGEANHAMMAGVVELLRSMVNVASWTLIGGVLGCTRQAAWERFTRKQAS